MERQLTDDERARPFPGIRTSRVSARSHCLNVTSRRNVAPGIGLWLDSGMNADAAPFSSSCSGARAAATEQRGARFRIPEILLTASPNQWFDP